MSEGEYKFLRFIPYKDFLLWDVKRYGKTKTSFHNGVLLKDILTPYSQPLSKEIMKLNNWQIISKINFGGQLFLRDIQELNTFKGNLCKVDDGVLIYSKINVRHGCVYYHPIGSVPFGVSSEYPAYRVDDKRVLGAFIVKVIQSNTFKKLLSQRSTGISKARVKPMEFLNTEIPLPSLQEQQDILTEYDAKIRQAEAFEKEAQQISKDIEEYLAITLGMTESSYNMIYHKTQKYFSFIKYKDLSVWGTDLLLNGQKQTVYKYPVLKIREICSLGSGGTPSRSQNEYYKGNIPWIKTGEVINEEILDTEEHITEEAVANSSAKLYPKGSLIIAMYGQGDTRGRTAKLGVDATTNQACAVLYNINNEIVSTDYLWYYLQGRYHDLRSLASGNNQPNLNAGKINSYDVVIPPKEVQDEIVTYIRNQKNKARELASRASDIKKDALINLERQIFEQKEMSLSSP